MFTIKGESSVHIVNEANEICFHLQIEYKTTNHFWGDLRKVQLKTYKVKVIILLFCCLNSFSLNKFLALKINYKKNYSLNIGGMLCTITLLLVPVALIWFQQNPELCLWLPWCRNFKYATYNWVEWKTDVFSLLPIYPTGHLCMESTLLEFGNGSFKIVHYGK